MNNTYLIFTIDGNEYAINSSYVQMIIQNRSITKAPMLPEHVLGYINFDGSPIPLMDINIKFGNVPTEINDDTSFIVINDDTKYAIVSDSVNEILDFQEDEIKVIDKEIFKGIYSSEKNNILVINVNHLN